MSTVDPNDCYRSAFPTGPQHQPPLSALSLAPLSSTPPWNHPTLPVPSPSQVIPKPNSNPIPPPTTQTRPPAVSGQQAVISSQVQHSTSTPQLAQPLGHSTSKVQPTIAVIDHHSVSAPVTDETQKQTVTLERTCPTTSNPTGKPTPESPPGYTLAVNNKPSLNALPQFSPLSPITSLSFSEFAPKPSDNDSSLAQDLPNNDRSESPLASLANGDRGQQRGVRAALSVRSSLPPASRNSLDLPSPRLRESPSVPRRRTIVETTDHTKLVSPVSVVSQADLDPHSSATISGPEVVGSSLAVIDPPSSSTQTAPAAVCVLPTPPSPHPSTSEQPSKQSPSVLTFPEPRRFLTPVPQQESSTAGPAPAASSTAVPDPIGNTSQQSHQWANGTDLLSTASSNRCATRPANQQSCNNSTRMSVAAPILPMAMPIPNIDPPSLTSPRSLTAPQPVEPRVPLSDTSDSRLQYGYQYPQDQRVEQQQQQQRAGPVLDRQQQAHPPHLDTPTHAMLGLGLTTEPTMQMPSRSRATEKSRSYGGNPSAVDELSQRHPEKSVSMPGAAVGAVQEYSSRHKASNSASNMPAIPGLADAGPYPTAASPQVTNKGALAVPGAPNGSARPGQSGNQRKPPQGLKPPEEVCLECMMRDRDLADVCVQGEGVWDRASDVAWDDLKRREFEVLGTLSLESGAPSASFEDDSGPDDDASVSSPRSHGSSTLSEERRRRKKQLRDARRAKRDERDAHVSRVGWRGFKWEEGSNGDGFPKGFRGTRPGALTEKGIKNVLVMYPSSATLRYQLLQTYIRAQYRAVLEIRAEAARHGGYYPMPEEPVYDSSPTQSSHESFARGKPIPTMPRNSTDQASGMLNQSRSMSAMSAPIAALRQSPSTPAALGVPATTGQPQRPKSHYVPDREPAPATHMLNPNVRSIATMNQTAPSPSNRSQHLKGLSSSSVPKQSRESRFTMDDLSDTEDLWPPGSPGSTNNLRPFSLAVRAGAMGREGSEGGHSRRSLFGKWGGSVTSLFTGSGSMMDMHVGLEMDRRNRPTSSYQVHDAPRAASMSLASPGGQQRGRQSVSSAVFIKPNADDLRGGTASMHTVAPEMRQPFPPGMSPSGRPRSVSASRLTQASYTDDIGGDSTQKLKGLKGLLQKIKPKASRQKLNERRKSRPSPPPLPGREEDGITSELQPPPPMAFLVKKREHQRKASSSSLSQFTDSQGSLSPQPQLGPPGLTNSRSPSGPMAPSSGSGSISPTSSRYYERSREPEIVSAPLSGSPASAAVGVVTSLGSSPPQQARRQTEAVTQLPPGAAEPGAPYEAHRGSDSIGAQRGLPMEMLSASPVNVGPRQPAFGAEMPVYDEPLPMMTNTQAYRRSMQPSISSRTSVSTGMIPAMDATESSITTPYLQQNGPALPSPGGAPVHHAPNTSPPGSLSPNRYKNLPPLPPMLASPSGGMGGDYVMVESPDDPATIRASIHDVNKRMSAGSAAAPGTSIGSSHHLRGSMYSEMTTPHRTALPPSSEYFPTASPRYYQQQSPNLNTAPLVGGGLAPNPVSGNPSTGSGMLPTINTPPQMAGIMGAPNPNVYMPQGRQIQPRSSFDHLADARARLSSVPPGGLAPDPHMQGVRHVQSMYIQSSATGSSSSFGRPPMMPVPPNHGYMQQPIVRPVTQTAEKKERRRGIKSIFSKAR